MHKSKAKTLFTIWFSLVALVLSSPAYGQMPAAYPMKEDVAPSEVLPIDGIYRVSTLGKRIKIEQGRAYYLDPWTQAMFWRVQAGMVTLTNFSRTGAGLYVADDLPMSGKVQFTMGYDGQLNGVVHGQKYSLKPISVANSQDFLSELTSARKESSDNNDRSRNSDTIDDLPDFLKQVKSEAIGLSNDKRGDDPQTFLTTSDLSNDRDTDWEQQSNRGKTAFAPKAIPVAQVPTLLPERIFTGCEINAEELPSLDPTSEQSNRERLLEASDSNHDDRLTKRTFASFDINDVEDSPENMDGLCWKRLDGVWRELKEITLDRSKDDGEIWDVEGTELASLMNGNYTTTKFLVVAPNGVSDDEIWIASGLGVPEFTSFEAIDDVPLDEALRRGGSRKVYQARGKSKIGHKLAIDISRSGRIRFKLDGKTFLRPAPGVSTAAMNAQTEINDVFLLAYNLENLSASRKGYDVTQQDPFYLLQNPKFDVFAEVDANKYVISEKRTIPLGFTLIKEDMQGNVFRKTLVSSEQQFQETILNSFGSASKYSLSGAANTILSAVPASGQYADTSYGTGYKSTQQAMQSLRARNFVGEAVGYSRTKKYALVVDHPFVTLSDDFLDAIEDARRYGDYESIIDKFGTHYPYAVTYGANAKMTSKVTDEEYESAVSKAEGNELDAQNTIMESGINSYMTSNSQSMQGNKGNMGNENSTFVAVGGSGSWDQSGYSSGETPYPIMLDLRPIDELLNPINFPNEPEIYSQVRANLALAVNYYIAGNSRPLRNESLLPEVNYIPEPDAKEAPIEEWHIYTKTLKCTDKAKIQFGFVDAVEGRILITANGPNGPAGFAPSKSITVKCRDETKTKKYKYEVPSKGLLVLKGTRDQIAKHKISLELNWNYKPKIKSRRSNKTYKKSVLQSGLAKGEGKTYSWGVGVKGKPSVYLGLRMARVK